MREPARCPVALELADIQGNILTAYGRLGFPKGRILLLTVRDAAKGRALVERLRHRVTTALRWPSGNKPIPTGKVTVERPLVTLNLAFTFRGLLALGVPTRTLRGLPDEVIDGMAARAAILGDNTLENPMADWDPVWRPDEAGGRLHILVTMNARMAADGGAVPALNLLTREIQALCDATDGGVAILSGHRGADPAVQELSALIDSQGLPCPREHFGFTDAISDPVFDGQYPEGAAEVRARGFGATDGAGNWRPLATGEFLLGWPDEAQEIAGAAMPLDFSRNGTFYVYRKLHQDIAAWRTWVSDTSVRLAQAWGLHRPDEARETLLAKMAGRWSDGVPLTVAPDFDTWNRFNAEHPPAPLHQVREESQRERLLTDFGYRDDPQGSRCPVTAHIRRANTREMLDPRGAAENPQTRMGSALNNRRRLLRRGLPYGHADDPHGEHGILMLIACASPARQFEFVQQQWMNYGLDFNAGNDTCPLVGSHGPDAKFVIAAEPGSGRAPFIATGLPQFVRTRGGDYFFVPSMTALRMIAMGATDPT